MGLVRGCLSLIGRLVALLFGALLGAGIALLVALSILALSGDGIQPADAAITGWMLGLGAFAGIARGLRHWPFPRLLGAALLTIAAATMVAPLAVRFIGPTGAAGALTGLLIGAIILGAPGPRPTGYVITVGLGLLGGVFGLTWSWWGIGIAGIVGGLAWALTDPLGVAKATVGLIPPQAH